MTTEPFRLPLGTLLLYLFERQSASLMLKKLFFTFAAYCSS